nr:cytochrome c [arsenite-oxidising bacterium NT-25]
MRRLAVVLSGAAVAGLVAVIAIAQQQRGGTHEGVVFLGELMSPKEISVGRQHYADNCSSCHGAKLEGQADWKRRLDNGKMPAPPHDETGHTWHHSDQDLFTITKSGVAAVVPGYDSGMPAFDGVLSDAEIRVVLAYIKSKWPDRQREYQEKITANERGRP